MPILDGRPKLNFVKSVSTTVGDTFVVLPNGTKGFIPRVVTFTNASVSLATSTSTAGLYTAAAAGGTAIVTSATGNLTPLTTATKFKDGTIAATTDTITPTQQTTGTYAGLTGLFINVGGTNNVPATFDVYIEGDVLS
jgi:hypothetical protein